MTMGVDPTIRQCRWSCDASLSRDDHSRCHDNAIVSRCSRIGACDWCPLRCRATPNCYLDVKRCSHYYDCAVTTTATTVQRHATTCDFMFTIATATVMQLRCDCNQKYTCSFFCEVAGGCSQSRCRNRCGRPVVASLFTVILRVSVN